MKDGKSLLRAGLLALALSVTGVPVAYAATDTDTPVDTATDTVTDTAADTGAAVENTAGNVQDQAEGFDDWGLLGLLGLFGLLGLRRNNNRSVVVDGTRK